MKNNVKHIIGHPKNTGLLMESSTAVLLNEKTIRKVQSEFSHVLKDTHTRGFKGYRVQTSKKKSIAIYGKKYYNKV